jgi:hypothetical protein
MRWLENTEIEIDRLTSHGSSVSQPSSGMEERRSSGPYFSRDLATSTRPVPNQPYRTPQVSPTTRRDTPRVTWDDVYDHLPLLENDHRHANALQLAREELESGRLAPSDELLTLLRNMLGNPDTWPERTNLYDMPRQHESATSVAGHLSFPVSRNGPQPRTNGAHEAPRSVRRDHGAIVDGMYLRKTPVESEESCVICLENENSRCTFAPENIPNAGGETYHPECLERAMISRSRAPIFPGAQITHNHVAKCKELYRTSETDTTTTRAGRHGMPVLTGGRPIQFRV